MSIAGQNGVKRPGTYPTTIPCVVCKDGKLVEVYAWQLFHDALLRRTSFLKRMSIHCARCGVAYGKLPEKVVEDIAPSGVVREEFVESPGMTVAERTSRKHK